MLDSEFKIGLLTCYESDDQYLITFFSLQYCNVDITKSTLHAARPSIRNISPTLTFASGSAGLWELVKRSNSVLNQSRLKKL